MASPPKARVVPIPSDFGSAVSDAETRALLQPPTRDPALKNLVPQKDRAFGRYELLSRIAYGGMGEIFLARLCGPSGANFTKLVVIKRILSHVRHDAKHVAMFLDEAKLQALLTDPRVVQVYDMGQVDEHVYLAMEFVNGPSWKAVVDKAKALGEQVHPAHAIEMMAQACAGLSYAHNIVDSEGRALSIVHRDVNPHNLLVTYDGAVKIIDFGIAKSELSEGRTETGTIKGKFAYMSPEQAAAERVDRRSDIFALGICLYEVLTGDNPFRRTNIVLSLEAVQMMHPPPLDETRPDCTALQPVVERALAKSPDDRFADCAELGAALQQLVEDGVVQPPEESLPAWLQRLFAPEMAAHSALLQKTGSASQIVRSGPIVPVTVAGAKKAKSTTTAASPRPRSTSNDAPPISIGDEDVVAMSTHSGVFKDDPTSPVIEQGSDDGPPTSAGAQLHEEQRRRPSSFLVGAAAATSVLVAAAVVALAMPQTRAALLATPAPLVAAAPSVAPSSRTVVVEPMAASTPATTATPPLPAPPATPATPATPPGDAATTTTTTTTQQPRAPARAKKAAALEKVALGVLSVTGGGRETTAKVFDSGTRTVVVPGPITVTLRVTAQPGGGARVAVESDPWAILRVDNVGRGRTPILDVAVPAGRKVELSLSSPKAEGQVELTLSFRPE